jgi:hypothetical protein
VFLSYGITYNFIFLGGYENVSAGGIQHNLSILFVSECISTRVNNTFYFYVSPCVSERKYFYPNELCIIALPFCVLVR